MSEAAGGPGRAKAFRIVMAVGLLLTLAANVPRPPVAATLVTALTEARSGLRQTWAPPMASWLLRPFDALLSGTGLYVAASSAVLFLALMSLTRLRPRTTWAGRCAGRAVRADPCKP